MRVSGWTLNGIWSFLRPCLQATRPYKRIFQVGLPRCYLRLNSAADRSVSINVDKTRKHISSNIHGARMFLQCFPVFHRGNSASSAASFCLQDRNYAYATRQGILRKIRTSEHASNFCENFEKRPNFGSTFKLDGAIWYPFFICQC